MSGPYRRTIARDIRILDAFGPEDAPKQVATRLKISVDVVYDAIARHRRYRWMYQDYRKFYMGQSCQSVSNGTIESDGSTD